MKASILCVGAFAVSLLGGCSNNEVATNEFMNEKLFCSSPAVAEIQAWGKSGSQQICKIKHGPFVAWEGGYIHVRGQYENGKEVGIWQWYDASGKIVRQLDHSKKNHLDGPQ